MGRIDALQITAYVRVLTDRVPHRANGAPDWSRAHPYTLTHLAHHAARAGLIDQLLDDSEYLVHAHPRGLTPHLHHDTARLAAAVYRTGLHLHHDTTPQQRRQLLALDAARAGAHHLRHDLTHHIPPGTWTPLWATGSTFNPALRDTLTGHTNNVEAVACTMLDGRPIAVTTGLHSAVRVWDLATRRPVAEFLADSPRSVAFTSTGDLVISVHNDVAVYRRQPHDPTTRGGPGITTRVQG
ncbi:hypothetical protein ACFV8E_07335 [Streptomyces sp. NPDC059849]|uniref:hypothetical protein n=1 Tax=Streptomyces sp. NPDC059849 TaxID=3346969 RepID=UPI003657B8A0